MSKYNLIDFRKNVTSQFGEDGILEKIFSEIGTYNRWCCEIGAWDGVMYSNTNNLIKKGWSSLQIEADHCRWEALGRNFKEYPNVHCLKSMLPTNGLDYALDAYKVPTDLDLLVIDIDGDDYWMWKAVEVHRPRVVLIEANNSFPLNVEMVQKQGGDSGLGASALSLYLLGRKKDYTLVCYNTLNMFFLREPEAWNLALKSADFQYLFTIGQTEQPYFSTSYNKHIWNYGTWDYHGYPVHSQGELGNAVDHIKVHTGEDAWTVSSL